MKVKKKENMKQFMKQPHIIAYRPRSPLAAIVTVPLSPTSEMREAKFRDSIFLKTWRLFPINEIVFN
jgi:tartrate dehydratase beta subunit/fumarate hydratase class I family protein